MLSFRVRDHVEMKDIEKENYNILDLIDREKLQMIQDAFAEASQVASTITDLQGVPITTPSNHSDVCKMIRSSKMGAANCQLSARYLGAEAAKLMRPLHKECLSCGFTDAAAPIIVNGKHIANWLIGQSYTRGVDEQRIREYARDINVDEEKMAVALRDMTKISKERFEKILSFLWLMANEISAMGYQNLLQKKQTQELQKVKSQLEKHKNELEKMVADRTSALLKLNEKLSEQIQIKDRVQKEQEKLIAAIENTADSILITDEKPQILYVNPAFEKITGYTSQEVLGKNPNILKSGLHDTQFYADLWKAISSGKVWTGRFKNKNKNGLILDEDTTISSIKDKNGRIVNYVAVNRDVTKELELERQLQQVSKLESIGTLAAGIAHEINTPVQYTRDNTKFLEEAFQDLSELAGLHNALVDSVAKEKMFPGEIAKIREMAEEIDLNFLNEETSMAVNGALEGLNRISTIVQAMKEFSHPGSNEKQPEDLNALIESTIMVSKNEWKHHADLKYEKDLMLPLVPMISGQLKQVILNIIVNAAQAIAEKTDRSADEKGLIKISTRKEDGCVRVSIKDTGKGIPDSILEKIFDPFFTTKDVGKGTGQGLAIAFKTIVERHSGTLDVKSEVGVGTEFILTLPLAIK